MQHVFPPRVAIIPKSGIGIVTRGQTIVGGADDAVVEVDRHRTHLAKRIFRSKTRDMRKGHRVFRNRQAGVSGFHERAH